MVTKTDINNIIIRVDDKPTRGNIAWYNGQARPGEIVVDPTVNPPALYIGDLNGNLSSSWTGGAGGNGTPITPNSNVTINTITANIINNLQQLYSNNANITNLIGNTGNITYLTSNTANINNINSSNVTTTTLNSNTANITNLTGNTANITNITSSNLTSNTANITNLTSNTANITNLTSSNIAGDTANITNITSSNITSNTANIANLTSNTANITNLTSNTANITNLTTSNVTANIVTANTGNITTINSSTVNSNVVNANTANIANITSNNITSNTITTSGDANIGGNINTAGSITANNGFISNTLTTRTGPLTLSATGTNNITLTTGTGNIALGTQTYITNVKDPLNAQDAATKAYVDAIANGLRPKTPVEAATTAALAGTYNNGAAGLGATITLGAPITTLDGVTLTAGTSRILVKNQAAALENGIYVYTNSTTLTRAADSDTPLEYPAGTFLYVEGGSTFGSTGWALTSATPTAIGTDSIEFSQIASAASYTAGTGLALAGTQFSIAPTTVVAGNYGNATHVATFTVNAQGQLTAASNVAIAVQSIIANGTSNVSIPAINGNIAMSVGTKANLVVLTQDTVRVDGNILASGNITGNVVTGIGIGGQTLTIGGAAQFNGLTNLGPVGNITITGGSNGQVLTTNGAGVLSWNTPGVILPLANGTSNVNIPVASGNVTVGVGGVADVLTVTTTGANVTGTLTATGNVSGSNLVTAGNAIVTGNVVASSGISIGKWAKEGTQVIAPLSGTATHDVLSGAVIVASSAQTANVTLNVQGNATVTLNSMLAVGDSITTSYVMNNGATGYVVSGIQVDGVAQTVKWAGTTAPGASMTNSSVAFTFTIIKTAATPIYLVLGSFTQYA